MHDRSPATPSLLLPLLCAATAGAVAGACATHLRARRARHSAQRRLLRAAVFAAEKHCDQRRKNERAHPYINHPLRVAASLCGREEETCVADDVDVLIAAVLHDTVEDTETTLGEVEREFGARVAGLVAEVSDDKTLPKAERKRRQIVHAASASRGAKLVKLADKLDNLSDLLLDTPTGWSGLRVGEYFDWSGKVVAGLRGTDATLEARLDAVFLRSHEAVQAAERQAAKTA